MQIEGIEEKLSAPAVRALKENGVDKLADVTKHTRSEIEEMHGIGKNALVILDRAMAKAKVEYRSEKESDEVTRYINTFEGEVKSRLLLIRKAIRELIPKAKEKMSYGLPTYYYKENIVHFAGFKGHVGLYPTPKGIEHFSGQLKGYETSTGAIQFKNDKEVPYDLIKEIVRYRIDEVNRQ